MIVGIIPINTPCVWVDIPTQTCATTSIYPLFGTNNQTGTTCYTNCIPPTASATLFPVYTDGYGNTYIDVEAYVTPEQYYALARNRVEYYNLINEVDRARIQAEAENYRREEAARLALRIAANNTAKELLLSHLTAEQRKTFEKNQWFIVEGGKTKTEYRIRTTGYSGNIEILNKKKTIAVLCCHCNDSVPLHDHHLAQKIALEYDEERFLKIANRRAA